MSSTARRTVRHAYQDLGGAAPTASRRRRRRRSVAVVARLFGESRSVTAIVLAFAALLGLLLVRPMAMSMLSYHRTAALLAERRVEVHDLRARHARLERQHAYYQTDMFVAERARQYGLTRPGEQPFVIRELARPDALGRFARNHLRNLSDSQAFIAGTDTPQQPRR